MGNGLPDNALFGCFGGMSNVGLLTVFAGMEVVTSAGPGKGAIFCLGSLSTGAPTVIEKTLKVEHIVVVDGYPLKRAQRIVGQAGFHPEATLTLVNDCGNTKGPPTQCTAEDLQAVTGAILPALVGEQTEA